MSLLAHLRASGAEITLSPEGGITLRHAPRGLVEQARETKALLIAALKRERLSGIQYEDSALSIQLPQMMAIAYKFYEAGVEEEAAGRLIDVVSNLIEIAQESFESVGEMLNEKQFEVLLAVETLNRWCEKATRPDVLEGSRLADCASEVFSRPVSQQKTKFNSAAFA
jgi:hypothetical protein